ncbi:MAG: YqgE/AlgH family protein [Isosphaeraceae bacterium]|nr:YqgE/AlgH family protein [Isosphaeraceae bacterium]
MKSLAGHLLIAAPELLTPFFTKTVILMLQHDETGAMGLVINRPTEATVAGISEAVLGESSAWEKVIRLGGPVPGPIVALHTREDLGDAPVIPGLFSTVDAERFRTLVRERPEPSLVVANYSGWGPGQLESEFAEDSWVTLPADLDLVFTDSLDELWEKVVRKSGSRRLYQLLDIKEIPPDPRLN